MIALWKKDSDLLKAQPAFISSQLYRGVAGSLILMTVAVWESTQKLRVATSSPEFQAIINEFPVSTVVHPQVLRNVAVGNICTV
jgi:heme-degrading monooxygenase HmoA